MASNSPHYFHNFHFHFQARKVMNDEMSNENSSSIVNAGSFMLSPYHAHSRLNPKAAIILPFILISFFLLALLFIYIKRLYNYHHPLSTIPYTTVMLGYGELSYTSTTTSSTTNTSSSPTNSTTTTTTTTTTTSISDEDQLGLDKRVLDSFPRVMFGSIKTSLPSYMNKKMQSECAICLEEFGETEILHLLPPCGHLFHSKCIHMWLLAHTNCPLCRYSLDLLYTRLSIDNDSQGEIAIAMQAQQPFSVQLIIPDQEINPTMEVSTQAMTTVNCHYNEGESSTIKPSMRRAKLERWHSTGRSLGGRKIRYCMKGKELDPPNSSPLLSLIMGDFRRSRSSISLSDEGQRDLEILIDHKIEHPSSSSSSSPTTFLKVPPTQMKDVSKSSNFSLKFLKRSSSDKFNTTRIVEGHS